MTGLEIGIIIALIAISTACTIALVTITVVDKVQGKLRTTITGAKGIMVTPIGSTKGKPIGFYQFGKNVETLYAEAKGGDPSGMQMVNWDVVLPGDEKATSHHLFFPLRSFVVKFRFGDGKHARDCRFKFKTHHSGGEVKGYDISFLDDIFFPRVTRKAASDFVKDLAVLLCTSKYIMADTPIVRRPC